MTQDSRSHHDGLRVGGVAKITSASDAVRKLPEMCYTLRRKVIAFLEEQTDDEMLRNAQGQARVSMGVIEEALRRYG